MRIFGTNTAHLWLPALGLALGLALPEARADLYSPPPPCQGKAQGDACETLHLDRGVCEARDCKAKEGDGCLVCIVPPDPPVNDAPAPIASITLPPAPPSAQSPSNFGTTALGAGVLAAAGALAFWLLKRNRKP